MNIQVSISVPSDLLSRIDDLAASESRSRSNMITRLLENACMSILDTAGRDLHRRGLQPEGAPDIGTDRSSPEIDETPAHRHTKETLIAGGLHKCSCGSIRGKDGSWS